MQRADLIVRALIQIVLPRRSEAVGALVAEKNAAAQWSLKVCVAVTKVQIGTVAARLCGSDFIDTQRGVNRQRAQRISRARRARRIDAADDECRFKPGEIHAMSVLFEAATRAGSETERTMLAYRVGDLSARMQKVLRDARSFRMETPRGDFGFVTQGDVSANARIGVCTQRRALPWSRTHFHALTSAPLGFALAKLLCVDAVFDARTLSRGNTSISTRASAGVSESSALSSFASSVVACG